MHRSFQAVTVIEDDGAEYEVRAVVVVSGRYVPASRTAPPEYPEWRVERVTSVEGDAGFEDPDSFERRLTEADRARELYAGLIEDARDKARRADQGGWHVRER